MKLTKKQKEREENDKTILDSLADADMVIPIPLFTVKEIPGKTDEVLITAHDNFPPIVFSKYDTSEFTLPWGDGLILTWKDFKKPTIPEKKNPMYAYECPECGNTSYAEKRYMDCGESLCLFCSRGDY